jgi:hypothetical protein
MEVMVETHFPARILRCSACTDFRMKACTGRNLEGPIQVGDCIAELLEDENIEVYHCELGSGDRGDMFIHESRDGEIHAHLRGTSQEVIDRLNSGYDTFKAMSL